MDPLCHALSCQEVQEKILKFRSTRFIKGTKKIRKSKQFLVVNLAKYIESIDLFWKPPNRFTFMDP